MDSSGNIPHLIRSFSKAVRNFFHLRTQKGKQSPPASPRAEAQNKTSIQNRLLPEPPASARLSEQNAPSRLGQGYRSPKDAGQAAYLQGLIQEQKKYLEYFRHERNRLTSTIRDQKGRGNKAKHEKAMLADTNANIKKVRNKIGALRVHRVLVHLPVCQPMYSCRQLFDSRW